MEQVDKSTQLCQKTEKKNKKKRKRETSLEKVANKASLNNKMINK